MFECRSCALRCMRAVAGDAAVARQPLQQRLLLTPHLQQRPSRRAASTAATQQSYVGDAFDHPTENDGDSSAAASAVPTQIPQQRRKATEIENKKHLELELRYLKDPFKLSEHVKYTLKCDKPDKALDLCRLASKTMSCVVSWNAVIDWHMRNTKVNEAFKIYNEMKKRAQFPDSYTYMLVLRGLGLRSNVKQPVKEENVSKAIAIYTSMNAANSRAKPTIMHTNAVLNVCALALDMDALWSIAGQIPQTGPNAADKLTYTIILNAIRHSAYGNNPDNVSLEQIAARRQKAVDEGKRVWLDIIRSWRAGEVKIDEDLVASMGRLLLTSKRMEDWDNVLDLVRQTMNIERLIAPVGSPERHTEHVPQLKIAEPTEQAKEEAEEVDEDGFTHSPATKAFKVVKPIQPTEAKAKSRSPKPLVYAEPGPQIISVLVDACQQMRVPRVASAYWDLLTSSEHAVEPDLENFNRQLSLLAKNRASAKAARLISEDLPAAGLMPRNSTFRIAMSACQRDMKNHHVLEHANVIVDAMQKYSSDPDPQTLMEYLSLALTTNDGAKISNAINRLDPITHNLRSRVAYGPDRQISNVADVRDIKQACVYFQTLIGTIDTLVHRGLVPSEDVRVWLNRRGDLNQFVTSAKRRVEQRDRALHADPEGDKRLGKPVGLMMSREQWALRKFRYNDAQKKENRREDLRQERDARFNPPRMSTWEAEEVEEQRRGGFGM